MPDLPQALSQESHLLQSCQVPIITVSGTFRKELLSQYQATSQIHSEAIFSRAHYSMAAAVHQAALNLHKTSHLVDPTNFVTPNDWAKIDFTEHVGQLMARNKPLKWIKDKIDTIARSKLPITDAITPPLIELIKDTHQPLISLHYEAGNIAAQFGKPIIQVLTDPHVRPQYLDPLPPTLTNLAHQKHPHTKSTYEIRSQIHYCVFDLQTKRALLQAALQTEKILSPEQVIVTGPPVDPRITKLAKTKRRITKSRPINIGITTGGLGTNLNEIKQLLQQITGLVLPPSQHIKLFLYAGSHPDFRQAYETWATENNLKIGNLEDTDANLRILYEDSIIDANDNLIKYMFPWADTIITKPSGDMAYDAAAAGCALLFLEPWGKWEQNIQDRFIKLGVASDLNIDKAHKHLSYLISTGTLKKHQTKAINLPPLYRQGSKKIVQLQQQLAKTSQTN